jgi:hypothetical protein
VHGKLIALGEAIFGTEDIRTYEAELWAKHSEATSYEQERHRDYLNHTPLVPSASDLRWRGLEMFIWLSDVPEDHGPAHIVPLPVTAGVPALPHGYLRSERPDFFEHEQSGAGPAGTVVAYSTDTFHRGTETTGPRSARYSAHVSYRHADNLWTGRHAWGDRSFHPDWKPFVEQATVRQLLLFGFPPAGHPYWTRRPSKGCKCATQVSTRAHGVVRNGHAAYRSIGTCTAAWRTSSISPASRSSFFCGDNIPTEPTRCPAWTTGECAGRWLDSSWKRSTGTAVTYDWSQCPRSGSPETSTSLSPT